MNDVQSVTVRPGVGMLALFPSMNYKQWYAIGEFIDNAIQSWRAHETDLARAGGGVARLRIEVEIDRAAGRITVTDNAAGIFAEDIGRAFTPAAPPADATGLSQFGIGMKSAASWYARHFVVTTTALGEGVRRQVVFDIPRIVESGAETIPLTTVPERPEAHGTRLVLTDLNHPAPTGRTLGKIRDYLSSIYRVFLADDRIEMVVGGVRLRYGAPELLKAPRWSDLDGEVVEWRKDVAVDLPSGRRVTGWAGLFAKGDTTGAGFALLYRGKVVQGAGGMARDSADSYKPHQIFGSGNSFQSQRLVGELDVSQIDVTHTKDSLVWDDEDEAAFLDRLEGALDEEPLPLLKMARNYRTTERGRMVQTTVRGIVDSVARATEMSAKSGHDVETAGREAVDGSAGPTATEAVLDGETVSSPPSPPVEQVVPLGDTEWSLLGESLRISVIDDPADLRHWLRVVQDDGDWVVTMNRAHRFTQSFADLPGMDLEPVFRLAVAISLSQIKAERSGSREPRFFIAELNKILGGPLAERNES
ncbi:ATP-binding protein [Cellulomonas sp. CW35]|uniref:ATP-binding protein n=1 Tax=Cellulomonas sp. CW35 TaxID=3458249 RepID=UPI004033A41A